MSEVKNSTTDIDNNVQVSVQNIIRIGFYISNKNVQPFLEYKRKRHQKKWPSKQSMRHKKIINK